MENENKVILVGNDKALVIADAVLLAKRVERVTQAFAVLGSTAREVGERMVEFSVVLEHMKDKDDGLIKISKSQTNNWNRKNRYNPIYRSSSVNR